MLERRALRVLTIPILVHVIPAVIAVGQVRHIVSGVFGKPFDYYLRSTEYISSTTPDE
jgi:hypothetical protein